MARSGLWKDRESGGGGEDVSGDFKKDFQKILP
jgi:hypothetical protein